ncbi:phospho-N-acetylmuramoyl-pentapeptide-transferase [Clostridium sp.]|uniref:phospho-N-acetylmuramoyl-pentapeptide- transferase n=1 Tax=Clostridium sp. TaxID=1506 RepID=UPI00283FC9C2|nr:phospho-N-acetylmuramoyl-pentapeptide-transferase [Clostridium sp.]MDR3594266.1 phospho-N-acetylmuramoyl-pentapeptide-transferase [Clostridium sp.]
MTLIILGILSSFFITFLIGKLLIPIIRTLNLGQNIREEGPKSHQKKAGTPTFGGIIFILASIIVTLILCNDYKSEGIVALYALSMFGLVGLTDDTLKKLHKGNEGLKPMQKLFLLFMASCIFAFYAYSTPSIGTSIYVPIINTTVDIKLMYIPFIIFYYLCTTNAVNLTDGLDGLCSTVTIIVMIFLLLLSFSLKHYSLSIFCGIIVGCLLAFLIFNAFPAKIIMGDTGSLALGGAIATVAMILKTPLIIIIIGGIYVIETLSVIIQVTSFKLYGRRVFKMAPIHHAFELSGFHETKIVAMFSITTIILCLIAFLLFVIPLSV